MDNTSYTIRVPKRLGRIAAIVGVLALIFAPLAAVATHSFNDVPNSHTFHGNIEWLKASGVTKGCNPPANTLFCPDDNVTRGQMAAFMERFAGYLGAEDGTPAQADNADTVDGQNADDFAGADHDHQIERSSSFTLTVPADTTTDLTSVDISLGDMCSGNASADNHRLLATWSGSVNEFTDLDLRFYVAVDGSNVAQTARALRPTLGEPTVEPASFTTLILGVPSGDHTVTVRAQNDAADETSILHQSLIVEARGWECTSAPLGISGDPDISKSGNDPETTP